MHWEWDNRPKGSGRVKTLSVVSPLTSICVMYYPSFVFILIIVYEGFSCRMTLANRTNIFRKCRMIEVHDNNREVHGNIRVCCVTNFTTVPGLSSFLVEDKSYEKIIPSLSQVIWNEFSFYRSFYGFIFIHEFPYFKPIDLLIKKYFIRFFRL